MAAIPGVTNVETNSLQVVDFGLILQLLAEVVFFRDAPMVDVQLGPAGVRGRLMLKPFVDDHDETSNNKITGNFVSEHSMAYVQLR